MESNEKKWMLYKKRYEALFNEGVRKGLICCYEDELIKNLRHVYCGGLPLSILMLCNKACNSYCIDRAIYITFGFLDDDFEVIDADIDSIRLNPEYIEKVKTNELGSNYGQHRFVERIKKDGTVWVYDTSLGLAFEKKIYYELQHPQIKRIMNKEQTMKHGEFQELKNANINVEKYALPILLPIYEDEANHAVYKVTQELEVDYTAKLKKEIELLKNEIEYESICSEVINDMKSVGLL